MASVEFSGVSKVYAEGTRAVDGMDLKVGDGEFMIFVGPSGCGKTTALRMVAGLEAISEGTISIGEEVVNDRDCGERDIAMVFQNYALYPHMTVYENMNFPLRLAGLSRAERDERIKATARTLGLDGYLGRRPSMLSGGQRQRVAMGRALVRKPQVFLMDEPLSNLDAKLRVQMRGEITSLQRSLGITTIYVTHDQVEALTMGDRIAVMRGGRLQQAADPQTLYDRPGNLFVAAFIGAPSMNLIEGELAALDGEAVLVAGRQRVRLSPGERPAAAAGARVVAGIRPEALRLADGAEADRTLSGTVVARESVGSDIFVSIAVDDLARLSPEVMDLAHVAEDRAEQEALNADRSARVTIRLAPDATVPVGDRLALAVPPGSLRLFDRHTGRALDPETPTSVAPGNAFREAELSVGSRKRS
ncbi:MAG: ABC transporter ATP-binding protein [Parvibaculaceae bacterium]